MQRDPRWLAFDQKTAARRRGELFDRLAHLIEPERNAERQASPVRQLKLEPVRAGKSNAVQREVALEVGNLLAGAVIVEMVFAWPGIGQLAMQSIFARDFLVVQAIVLFSALSFMASTLLVDLLYAWLDPRISYRTAA